MCRPAAGGRRVVAVTEVIQATRGVEPTALMQVDPGEGAAGAFRPVRIKDRHLAERVVDVALDHVARVVKQHSDTIVGVLHHPQAFVQRAVIVHLDMKGQTWCSGLRE